VRLLLRELRMGVRRVYGLLYPIWRGGGGEGDGRRGYELRVLEYLQTTFLGTSLSATHTRLIRYWRRLERERDSHP
jgi:hypothetical protein